MGWPVVIVSSGGIAVTESESGLATPVTPVDDNFGIPVTVVNSGGFPVTGVGARISFSGSILEGAAENTVVGTPTLVDPLHTYQTGGTWSISSQSNANWFKINSSTGAVSAGSSATDYETNPSPTVTLSYDDGVLTPLTSPFTIPVTNVAAVPVNTVRPTITSDGLSDGDTQHGSNGTWTAVDAVTGYTYQWYYALLDAGEPVLIGGLPVSDGAVTGATAIDYDWVVADDEDKWVFLKVIATNINGGSLPAYSDAVGPMAAVAVETFVASIGGYAIGSESIA